ncbi:MAG TPA: Rho termination factor N-terminal domain-containing protein [Solirubrobacteraceae bacterium]|nr:Rho termination factor N-terminal domain-containing protein [Solirubrobacteraceae bacterium]
MSVLDRSALTESPLADLHAIAGELSIDGFRRLRKAELIDAIIARQGGEEGAPDATDEADDATADIEASDTEPRRPRRRGGRGRSRSAGGRSRTTPASSAAATDDAGAQAKPQDPEPAADEPERIVEGTVELQGGGSGFVRLSPPEPSDDDVYISAAQVRRCELVPGDVVTGPLRPARRSERYASLARVDTINGVSAANVGAAARYDDLPCSFPAQRLELGGDDPTLEAIDSLMPLGLGSRVTIVGGARSGKSETLRRIAAALAGREGVRLQLALAGVRPEELAEWTAGPVAPAAAVSLAASGDARLTALEGVVEQGRRLAVRGADAVVLIDTLDGLAAAAAQRLLAAARNLVDGGSLTIVATAAQPLGGETTVVALDAQLAAAGRFPALDIRASGVLHPELLVGDDGAAAIVQARAT